MHWYGLNDALKSEFFSILEKSLSCCFNLLNKNFFWKSFSLNQIGIDIKKDVNPFGAKAK